MEFQKPRLPPKAPRSTLKPSNVVTHDLEFYVHPNLVPDQDPCKGRLLRAAGPIREGTVLLVDTPYAIVPSVTSNEPLICSNLSCSRRVPQNGRAVRCEHACSKDVVWCNVACRATDKARHDFECSWLKKHAEPLRQEEGEYNFATVTHQPDGQARMVYTAARDISKGEEGMITYFDLTTHKDLTSRQNHTQEQFQFKCTCERCLKEEAEENIECMDSLPFGF
ncbi:hypothetical protein FOC1_g10006982 [Fusarium oxysporum f. sp. cubense race 1]|uniref:SET domain-containing protein n=1 Tax=Fusarium oxysporum f. sp. cubense (strain race 1) TaxID=1229664 RepID=N4UB43_FUSC1|nr:hypothetical protein FOC1_g10006982 [Fusarium oxysporum f. sp. cubense race 1]